jgi:hypothetical protein
MKFSCKAFYFGPAEPSGSLKGDFLISFHPTIRNSVKFMFSYTPGDDKGEGNYRVEENE